MARTFKLIGYLFNIAYFLSLKREIKIMKKYGLLLFTMFCSSLSFAQITKDVGSFSSLKVYDNMVVVLEPSSKNQVNIGGSKAQEVVVVNKNGTLKIRMKPTEIMQGDEVRVKVYFTNLSEVQASQGAQLSSSGTIKANLLSITSNEGSNINLDVAAKSLEVKANTGGRIHLTGTANVQRATVNTGAFYDGQAMQSKITEVTVKAGGAAKVYASKAVEAKTRAGGEIVVFGNPEDKKTDKFLGGDIHFE